MKRRTWQRLLSDALAGIYPALESMTDRELRRVCRAPGLISQTNCWWLAYHCAPQLADVAQMILNTRKRERRSSRRRIH